MDNDTFQKVHLVLKLLIENRPCRQHLHVIPHHDRDWLLISYTGPDSCELSRLQLDVQEVLPRLFKLTEQPHVMYCQSLPERKPGGTTGQPAATTQPAACLQKPVTKDWLSRCGMWIQSPQVHYAPMPLRWHSPDAIWKYLGFGSYLCFHNRFAAYVRATAESEILPLCRVYTRQDVVDVCRLLEVPAHADFDFIELSQQHDG